jgi:hypothetical protein
MAVKRPDLDEATLRIAERVLKMPPKPHDDMKLGARRKKTKRGKKKRAR